MHVVWAAVAGLYEYAWLVIAPNGPNNEKKQINNLLISNVTIFYLKKKMTYSLY